MQIMLRAILAAVAVVTAQSGFADEAKCRTVNFADVGWSDIAATTGLASVVLEGLGYQPKVTIASVPIVFAGIRKNQIDAFLGYWSPSMTPVIEPFLKSGDVRVLETPNLVGAKYTLAVPQYLFDQGLKSFADIARFEKELGSKIHGIEPGNDGNALIAAMIKENRFGLKGFRLVESSEAGMLVTAKRAVKEQKSIVFLGWEPHPMNAQMKMKYLAGGDEVFGPNFGGAEVYTAIPPSYEKRCPNVYAFLKNLQFSTAIENEVMGPILNKVRPKVAAQAYLKKNPGTVDKWLEGVTTFDGRPGLEAVKAALAK